MIYLLAIAAGVALVLLYKFSSTPKNFIIICTLVVSVFGASAFIRIQQLEQEQISRAQLEELQEQQKIFGEWYAAYQKQIDRLDRNWQSYHNIIDGLQSVEAQTFNAEATHARFKDLEQDAIDEQITIHMLTAPQGLDSEIRARVDAVIEKTQRYAEAQTRTISLSENVAAPPVDLDTLRLSLNDIMIRESPEGLFTAQEISAIRAALGD